MCVYDRRPWLAAYDPGVDAEVDLPDEPITAAFERVRQQFPERAAFHFLGVSWTFAELFTAADRFARALADRGIGRGDVVAINLPNLPQYLVAQLGAGKLGCWVSGLSPLLQAEEMAFQLRDSRARALVTLDPIFEHRLAPIAGGLPDLKLAVSTGIADVLPWLKRTLAALLKKVPTGRVGPLPGTEVLTFRGLLATHPPDPPGVALAPDDVYLLQYTGGTTGVPKGALLTQRNLMSQAIFWNRWFGTEVGQAVSCSGYPYFHVGGQCSLVATLWHGATQILIPNPRDTGYIVQQIRAHRPDFINNVPALFMMLMADPGFRDLDFSRLAFATSAAAPFPVEPMRELEALIGGERVVELYGLTETSPIICANPTKGRKKIGSVGLPAPSTHVRLVALADGETPVPQGERGELIVRGPQVMRGYWNNEAESAIALREHDGEVWLHTGDVAVMDAEGYFTIVDRCKDMIIVSGYKVFPREVEEKLYALPAVDLCTVVGVPNPDRPGSELVKLIFTRGAAHRERPDDEVIAEVRAFCQEHLGKHKVPKLFELVDELPLTAAGKVDRKALR